MSIPEEELGAGRAGMGWIWQQRLKTFCFQGGMPNAAPLSNDVSASDHPHSPIFSLTQYHSPLFPSTFYVLFCPLLQCREGEGGMEEARTHTKLGTSPPTSWLRWPLLLALWRDRPAHSRVHIKKMGVGL